MKKLFLVLIFLISFSAIAIAKPTNVAKPTTVAEQINIERRLYDLEHKVKIIDASQLNYQIEKDLLKETYSINYKIFSAVITLILGIIAVFGYLGLKDITSIKKQYQSELDDLKDMKNQFESKSKEFDTKKESMDEELRSIIEVNQEQNQKIKFIEIKDKVPRLIDEGNLSLALEFANIALEINPSDSFLLRNKGAILTRLNQIGDALQAFRKAAKDDPDNLSNKFDLVECLYFSNNIDEAKEIINQNKETFTAKCNGKLLEFLELIELYFNGDKDVLLDKAKSYVNHDSLKIKEKKMGDSWRLKEAESFARYLEDGDLKIIIQNIIWYWNGKLAGEGLLTKLGIPLPKPPNKNE